MATSLTGGAFGFLRKSIGSVTYRTSTAALDGKKRQVASLKPTTVKNPKTVAQIMQRMKMAPAAKFYDTLSDILDHSWEGVTYGAKSRLEFMRRAMKNDPAVYVPFGYKSVAPGEYEVSAGSLPSLPWRKAVVSSAADTLVGGDAGVDAESMAKLNAMGIIAGDQITFVALVDRGGIYETVVDRLVLGTNGGDFETHPEEFENIAVTENGLYCPKTDIAAFAAIVSRGKEAATAKRSSEKMLLLGKYRNLLSLEAMNTAIESYQTQTAYNTLNSEWYLNQGSSQPFNGRIVAGNIAVTPTGGQSTVVTAAIAQHVDKGQIQQALFTVDGSAESALIGKDGQPIKVGQVTITAAMVNDKSAFKGEVAWKSEYLDQAGF